ncbi:SDR family oxidoreductase [Yunchengibacter salinarum]|uniref:SDR family oxidoreductase n=1 Tax=Yunchengibacter salinarum TaxID=3133399 RepID=UPI0035B5D03D
MANRLKGKTALVTGGASGLGAAIVAMMMREGANVYFSDIQDKAGEALARKTGARYRHQDVTREDRWESLMTDITHEAGGLHILVNNAGLGEASGATSPEDTPLATWRRVQEINLDGVFLGCRAALPVIRESGGGAIVNMSSIAALVGTPFITAYGAAKAGVRQLTMSVALHAAATSPKVRCNSVHPGQIMTPMLDRLFDDTAAKEGISREEAQAAFVSRIPMAEFGEPDDIAHAVLYLASDEAKHVTGAQLVVDGGMHIV